MKYLFPCLLLVHGAVHTSQEKPDPKKPNSTVVVVPPQDDDDAAFNRVLTLLEGLMVLQACINEGRIVPDTPNTPD